MFFVRKNQFFGASKKDEEERGAHNSCAIGSPPSCPRGEDQRRKHKHRYSVREGAGMLNKEETEHLFHTLNSDTLGEYKGKTCWSAWESFDQGSGSSAVKSDNIEMWLQCGTVSVTSLANCCPNNLSSYRCSWNCYLVQNSLLVVAFLFLFNLVYCKTTGNIAKELQEKNQISPVLCGRLGQLPGRSFKSSLAMWDVTGARSRWGTENYRYTSLLVPGRPRQISCRNWSYELMQTANRCDKEASQQSRKRHPPPELWQGEPKEGSCACLWGASGEIQVSEIVLVMKKKWCTGSGMSRSDG